MIFEGVANWTNHRASGHIVNRGMSQQKSFGYEIDSRKDSIGCSGRAEGEKRLRCYTEPWRPRRPLYKKDDFGSPSGIRILCLRSWPVLTDTEKPYCVGVFLLSSS